MKNLRFNLIIISIFVVGVGYTIKTALDNEVLLKSYIKRIIPNDSTKKISKYILPYREINQLERENFLLKKLEEFGIENDIKMKEDLVNIDFIKTNLELSISGKKITLNKYSPAQKTLMRGIYNKIPGSAYLEKTNNKLFLLSSTGILAYSNYNKSNLTFR